MEHKKRVEQLSLVDDPQKVKVLILTDQKTIYSDFYFITRFINIVKLDLSYNKLSGFPIGFSFKVFAQMKTLFLHYNKFASIKSVQIVAEVLRHVCRVNFWSIWPYLAIRWRKLKLGTTF